LYLPNHLGVVVEVQDFQYSTELLAATNPEEEQEETRSVHHLDKLEIATVVVYHVACVFWAERNVKERID
jgi:hypothetical protein